MGLRVDASCVSSELNCSSVSLCIVFNGAQLTYSSDDDDDGEEAFFASDEGGVSNGKGAENDGKSDGGTH